MLLGQMHGEQRELWDTLGLPSSPGCGFWWCQGVRQGCAPCLEVLQLGGAMAELLPHPQGEQLQGCPR